MELWKQVGPAGMIFLFFYFAVATYSCIATSLYSSRWLPDQHLAIVWFQRSLMVVRHKHIPPYNEETIPTQDHHTLENL